MGAKVNALAETIQNEQIMEHENQQTPPAEEDASLMMIAAPKRYYLSGPMSSMLEFNFPAFRSAAEDLRNRGYDIVSPAELDEQESKDGHQLSWGDYLSRDVKLIADDGVVGIIFLPEWYLSRGAKLEAYVGLLVREADIGMPFEFWHYHGKNAPLEALPRHDVMHTIAAFTL